MITEAYSRLPLHEALHAAGHAHQPHVHSSVEQQPHAHAHTQQHQHSHPVHDASEPAGMLFIENVGNLVCPGAMGFGRGGQSGDPVGDRGRRQTLKYPDMFAAARLMILNKIDLLPHLDFDVQRCLDYARQVNPQIQIIQLSARDGTGLDAWLDWAGRPRGGSTRRAHRRTGSRTGPPQRSGGGPACVAKNCPARRSGRRCWPVARMAEEHRLPVARRSGAVVAAAR
jgi:hydrogenase nickel incorporation protein HypB